jgi:pimeloyl-ACP methyl ester carboxylesterase
LGRFIKTLGINERIGDHLKKSFEETFGERWKVFQDPRFAEGMKTPLLVVHDHDDPQVSWEEGRRLASTWQGARFQETRGLGHNRLLKDPEVIHLSVDFIHRPKHFINSNERKGESHENYLNPLAQNRLQSVHA